MTPRRWTMAAAAIASALVLALSACGDDDGDDGAATPTAAPDAEQTASGGDAGSQELTGGTTTLVVDADALGALDAAGIGLSPLGEASEQDGRFTFPITGGTLDAEAPSGRIEHAGGLRISVAGQELDARELVLEPAGDVLTAEIGGERVPLLSVDVAAAEAPESDAPELPGSSATLSPDALDRLQQQLGTDLPIPEVELGRVDVSAER